MIEPVETPTPTDAPETVETPTPTDAPETVETPTPTDAPGNGEAAGASGSESTATANPTEAATNPDAELIPGVGQPDHKGFYERMKAWAVRLEVEVYEDAHKLAEALSLAGPDMPAAIEDLKKEYNIK